MGDWTYEAKDFLTPAPYEALYQFHGQPFVHETKLQELSVYAANQGFRGFKSMYKKYIESLKAQAGTVYVDNVTNFTGQPLELNAGDWDATDLGVYRRNGFADELACPHPIMPVERLINIDTGEEKLKLAFRKGTMWRRLIISKTILANANKVTELAGSGIAVTSQSARAFVQYISDLENLNYDTIPERKCIGRLGYIQDEGFSPFVDGLIFDGDANFKALFSTVRPHGEEQKWVDVAREVRGMSTTARIILAASFASVLLEPLNCLPFFVHLWGGSETGKSLSLVLAASVWANPEIGVYIQTFNATEVGKELGAAFCNSLPLIIDELQLVKDNRKDFDRMIYQLSEGVGRARGRKQGGLQKTPTWRNCVITTGEFPIISANSGEGAVNRTIEVDCHDTKLFDEPKKTATSLYANYGFAGREFVDHLMEDGVIERVQKLQEDLQKAIKTGDTMDKQTASAALILAADRLSEEWIFQDGVLLQPDDIRPYLVSKETVNQNARALQYLYDFININQSRFSPGADAHQGEVWGDLDDDYAYIIRSKFDQILQDEGYNASAFLGWAKNNNLILPGKDGKMTRTKRINGRVSRCIWLKMDNYLNDFEENVEELLP